MITEIEKLSVYANDAQIDDAIARDEANGVNIWSQDYLLRLDHVFVVIDANKN